MTIEVFGPATRDVQRIIERAGTLTLDEAADIYRASAARLLLRGSEAERLALARASRAARRAGLETQYDDARHAAAWAWRHALPATQGPWLIVGQAIANAAGAVAVGDVLDDKTFEMLFGPWRQALGTLTPVGPGVATGERITRGAEQIAPALEPSRRR